MSDQRITLTLEVLRGKAEALLLSQNVWKVASLKDRSFESLEHQLLVFSAR